MNIEQLRFSAKPIFITLLLMLVLACLIKVNLGLIPSIPASAPDHIFSAERAKNVLSELLIEQVPHPVDTLANRVVEQRIVEKLRAMGYQEEIQDAQECRDYDAGVVRCTRVRNIIVTIDGTQRTDKREQSEKSGILLSAHYDSVGAGSGASDAGAAVATLLEIARILALQDRPRNNIVLLFNEGEEFGLFGAHAFMRHHPLAKKLKLALNIEARGSAGQSVMFETGENSGWLVEAYMSSTPAPLSSSLFYEVYKYLPNDTDLTVFKEHGLQGLNFAHAENEPHYHTPLDNLANLKLGTIQHHGDNVWGVLKQIKDQDLTNLNQNNIVYTDILGRFMIKWQEPTSLIVSVILCLLFVFIARNLAKESLLDGKSIKKGVYTFFTLVVLLSVSALLVQKLVQLISGGSTPWRVDNFPMQLTLWASLTFIGLVVGKWFAKKACPTNFLLGLLICWLVCAIATSLFMVGISFLFIIPSSVAIVILLLRPLFKKIFDKNTTAVSLVIISIAVAVIFLPIVYILEIMVGYSMSLAIGLFFSFVVSGMTPLLTIKNQSKKTSSMLDYGLLVVFIIGLVWTVTQPTQTDYVPKELNLTHIQNSLGESYMVAGSSSNLPSEDLMTLMQGYQSKQLVDWSSRVAFNKQIDGLNLQPAEVSILSDENQDGQKIVHLAINSKDKNFQDIFLYVAKESKLKTIDYRGKTFNFLDEKSYRNGYYEFQCKGLSCQSIDVILTFATSDKVELQVVKSLYGLPGNNREFVDARGNKAVQRWFGDRTIIISKISL